MNQEKDRPQSEQNTSEPGEVKQSPQLPPLSDSLYQRYRDNQQNTNFPKNNLTETDQGEDLSKNLAQTRVNNILNAPKRPEIHTFLHQGKVETVALTNSATLASSNQGEALPEKLGKFLRESEPRRRRNQKQEPSEKLPSKPNLITTHRASAIALFFWQILKSFALIPTRPFFWLILLATTPIAIGWYAIYLLFDFPAKAECHNITWPNATASSRLYCAQMIAKNKKLDDLFEAINMVDILTPDHPLRPVIDRQLERWVREILTIADGQYQKGQLDEAMAIAQRIPESLPNYKIVTEQMNKWQATWDKAEDIVKKAEAHLENERWSPAFSIATYLLDLDNNYWATTKYEELTEMIRQARLDGQTLDKARDLADQGSLENLIKAVQIAREIPPESRVYENAKKVLTNTGERLLELADKKLEDGSWQEAMSITSQVPSVGYLEEKAKDFMDLARAAGQASTGTVSSLEEAIEQAKKIKPDRYMYSQAQNLIYRWQQEITDVSVMEEGRALASSGSLTDLKAAINRLQTISSTNSRSKEVQSQIDRWSRQVELLEDQPYLNQAEQLASQGDAQSLQAAIAQASQISPGRYLYTEAQNRIKRWEQLNQRGQDQPLLDQALRLGAEGNLSAAIAIAEKIGPGRYLYSEARNNIQRWQDQQVASQAIENARQAATPGTPESLETAIYLAQQVPPANFQRAEAEEYINRWSEQLLQMAQEVSSSDLTRAIAIARKIPPGNNSSKEARSQISIWQGALAREYPQNDTANESNVLPVLGSGSDPLGN